MLEKIQTTVKFLKDKGVVDPLVGIVLGTGLGGLTTKIDVIQKIDYKDIPNFPTSSVRGHEGKLIYGLIAGKKVVVMSGRFHCYEGYSADTIAFPIRVLKYLGIKSLFLSNAAGGMNPDFNVGDIMIITDHINLLPNPLIGPNDERIGPRFPDMSQVYDPTLISKAETIARRHGVKVQKGVYLSTTGPTFETPAEYKFFRTIGADAVGMSTTLEAIVAHHAGLPVFAVSIITDLGIEGKIENVSMETVLHEAGKAEALMTPIIVEMIGSL